MAISRPEPRKVNMLHMEGFRMGSSERYVFRKKGVVVRMKFGKLECRMVMGIRWPGMVELGVGRSLMARRRDRGPCVAGVRMRNVRAVSIGARMRDEMDEEINDSTSVAMGDVEARISAVMDEAISSSGRPTIAERRLRMNVLRVGNSNE